MRLLIALSFLLSPLLHAERTFHALDNGLKGIKPAAEQAALLKKLGYGGIVTRPGWCTQEMVDAFEKAELKILATYVVIPAGNEPPADLEKHFELIKDQKTIVWLSITKAKGKESTDENAAATARKVVDLAAKHGLQTCLYPHVNFHTATVKDCERVHKLAERPKLGLGFTLCHFLAQNPHNELEATLKRIAPHLMLVQVNGANQLDEPKMDWKQLIQPLGSGTFDVGRVIKTLDEIGYQGPVTLQCYNIKKAPAEHLAASIKAWKAIQQPQAPEGAKLENQKPNIIFIMADDLGYGDLGSYGQKHILTPHLDQMAKEGMRFTDFYSGAPVCAPARSVLMTGQHTGHTTVRGNMGKGGVKGLGGASGRVPLKAEDITVAEVLKEAGYITGMTGKWGLGEPGTSGEPNSQGFDEWYGYLNQRRAHDYYVDYLWHNRNKVELLGNKNGKQEQYTHDLCTDFALNFIETHTDKPFFLYIPYCIPHAKYQIPDMAPYADKAWKQDEKVHAAMITRMDRDIGRMLTLLKEKGIDQNTIVFFCSDNGAARRWNGRFDSSGKLRGEKRAMFEGGIRTPMIVRWPGKIQAGSESSLAAYFPDVLPTLAKLAGAKSPKNIDGVDISDTLLGKPQDLSERYLYWEFFERGFQQAVRIGNWKAIRQKAGQALELYDLSKDISEATNIAAKHPDVIKGIETYLQTARTESKAWPTE